MPDVYRYEWSGVKTGTAYRFDFLSHSDLPSYPGGVGEVVESLNDDCISDIKGFEWDVERWPYGLVSPPRCKVTFKAKRIPSTLSTWIKTTVDKTVLLSVTPSIPVYLTRGMTCVLWVGGEMRWIGTMDLGAGVLPDLKTGDLEVEFVDALQASMKALSWADIKVADEDWVRGEAYVVKRGVIERVWRPDNGDLWAYIGHVAPNNQYTDVDASRFWFIDCTSLFTQWSFYVGKMFQAYYRGAGGVSALPLFTMRGSFHKQLYTEDEAAGSLISSASDVYRLIAVTSSQDTDATFNYMWHDLLIDKSKCFWDWFVDYCDECFKFTVISYSGTTSISVDINSYTPLSTLANTAVDYALPTTKVGKPSLRSEPMRIATGATEYGVGEDYQKVDQTVQGGGRNDNTDTITVTSYPSPVISKYTRAKKDQSRHRQAAGLEYADIPEAYRPPYDSPLIGGGSDPVADPRAYGLVAYDYKPRFGGWYYLENPTHTSFDAFQFSQMIRCHSFTGVDGSTAPVSGPASLPAIPFTSSDNLATAATAWAITDQQTFGTLLEVARGAIETFGDANGSKVPFTAPIDSLAFMPDSHPITLDLASLSPITGWLDDAPTTWYACKVTSDLTKEVMEVEAYGK